METRPDDSTQKKDAELDADYRNLLQLIDYDPVSIDQMVERSGLPARSVSSMLLILELQGLIRSESGGRWCRVK
jgi:DNA processing protein